MPLFCRKLVISRTMPGHFRTIWPKKILEISLALVIYMFPSGFFRSGGKSWVISPGDILCCWFRKMNVLIQIIVIVGHCYVCFQRSKSSIFSRQLSCRWRWRDDGGGAVCWWRHMSILRGDIWLCLLRPIKVINTFSTGSRYIYIYIMKNISGKSMLKYSSKNLTLIHVHYTRIHVHYTLIHVYSKYNLLD